MEKMKLNFLLIAIIVLLICIGISYLINISENTISKELYEAEKKSMQDSIDVSKKKEAELLKKDSRQAFLIDSLEKKQEQYAEETEAAKDSIDKILARDSTQALKENRKALTLLGISVSSGPFLSNYEMGWNAKFLNENIGMKLQLNICNETKDSLKANIKTQKEIIAEKENQNKFTDSLKTIAEKNIEFLNDELESEKERGILIVGGYGMLYSKELNNGIFLGLAYGIYEIKLSKILKGIF